jgi:hypothetical protein
VAAAVILAAWRLTTYRPAVLWIAATLVFTSLALGPFLTVAGVRTFVPTPWTVLRYVPVMGEARMPPRFGILVALGVAALLAGALAALGRQYPARRRTIVAATAMALAIELWPAPRPLASAAVPPVYRTIARDGRPLRVLDVPFGLRDGLSSLGDFNASSLLYQTVHQKEMIGGYLSRLDDRTKAFHQQVPVLHALMAYSGGGTPDAGTLASAREAAASFVDDARLGYVVIDAARASGVLRQFAIEVLGLNHLETSGSFELYGTRLVREGRGVSREAD